MAEQCPDEALARPLAAWTRGNWEIFHDPQRAIHYYQQALAGYRAAGDSLSVARLLSNLVFPYTECGALDRAEAAAAEARSLLIGLGQPAAYYLMALEQHAGWLLHTQGRYAEALAAYAHALKLAHQLGEPTIAAEIQVNRTLTLKIVGRLAEEEQLLLESRAVADSHGQLVTVARIDLNLGELYAAQGRPMEALRRLQAARSAFATLGNPMEMSWVLLSEGGLLNRIGALRDARRSYAQAQAQFAALDLRPQVGIALVCGAAVSRKDGAFARAAQLLADAEAVWRSLDQPLWQILVTFERAELALAQGDAGTALALARLPLPVDDTPAWDAQRNLLLADALALDWQKNPAETERLEARRTYLQVLAYADRRMDRWLQRRALAGLGRLALPDDPVASRDYLEAAVAHDEARRQTLSVEELKASFQAHVSDLLPLLARLALVRGQPLEALAAAWRAKGGGLLDVLRSSAQVPADAQAGLERVRQQLAIHRWHHALKSSSDMPEDLRERSDEIMRDLEHQLYELRRQRRPAAGQLTSLEEPRQVLARMEADVLIEYMRCGDDLLAIRAERDGTCRAAWVGPVAAILDLLDELQLHFQHVLTLPAQRRFQQHDQLLAECCALLRRGYDVLIAPLGPLPAHARLLIAPCDPLYLVPFAALRPADHYLLERHTIQLIPCGALLGLAPDQAPTTAPLIIAASAGGRLAAVGEEAAAVQRSMPTSICQIDDPRSLEHLRALEAAPAILHIAAHSILREDAPIFSALQLAGEVLSVEQCYDLPLQGTRLVTLSGCTTATGLDTGGSLLAFQSALFAAGAHAVISSLWLIDDQATVEWIARFYQELSGCDPATALRRTQQALLATGPSRHPALWAAFACSSR